MQARLGDWATLNPTIDYETCPDDVWQRLLTQADTLVANNQKWFQIGIARAINEIKAKDADGNPRWPSRNALTNHLSQINEPNRG